MTTLDSKCADIFQWVRAEEVVGKPQKGRKGKAEGGAAALQNLTNSSVRPLGRSLSNKQRRKTKEALNASLVSLSFFVIFITKKRKEVGVILSYVCLVKHRIGIYRIYRIYLL